MKEIKQLAKSQTLWFGLLLSILGIIEINLNLIRGDLGGLYGYVVMGVGITIKILRFTTTKPLKDL